MVLHSAVTDIHRTPKPHAQAARRPPRNTHRSPPVGGPEETVLDHDKPRHRIGLPAQRRSELLPLAGALRLANALDELHDERIQSLVVERRKETVVMFAAGLTTAVNSFGEQLARARYLLESAIRMPIVFKPMPLRRKAPRSAAAN